jgi:hypothetical protein
MLFVLVVDVKVRPTGTLYAYAEKFNRIVEHLTWIGHSTVFGGKCHTIGSHQEDWLGVRQPMLLAPQNKG